MFKQLAAALKIQGALSRHVKPKLPKLTTIICKNCGAPKVRLTSQILKGAGIFCSVKCGRTWRVKELKEPPRK